MNDSYFMAVEMGNSATDVGLFRNVELLEVEHYPTVGAVVPMVGGLAERWCAAVEAELTAVFASVVPEHNRAMREELVKATGKEVIYVNAFRTEILPLHVDQPQSVGVDRIVNSLAASRLVGKPVLVTSLGTATTFEVIDADGAYLGGAICPGVGISAQALSTKAALLAPFEWEKPESLIGKTTLDHMRSGSYYGTLAMLEGMTRRFREALGTHAPLVGTGGFSRLLASENIFDVHDPYLTLKGLSMIAQDRIRKSE